MSCVVLDCGPYPYLPKRLTRTTCHGISTSPTFRRAAASCVALKLAQYFPSTTEQCRVLHSLSQFGPHEFCWPPLITPRKSTLSGLQTPSGWQLALMYTGTCANWKHPSTKTEIEPVSVWWTPFTPTWWLTENLLHATLVLPEDLSVTEPHRQLAGGGRWRKISGWLGLLLAYPQAWCWWKLALMCNLAFPTYTQAQHRQSQTVDCSVAANRLLRTSHNIWHWPATESLPRGPRTNTPSGQLQKISEQSPISSTSAISKRRSWQAPDPAEANYALCD